jgi:hypothetical protein
MEKLYCNLRYLREHWMPLTAFLALLGAKPVLLGVTLAAWASKRRRRRLDRLERKAAADSRDA